MSYHSKERYDVYAIAASGAKKRVAKSVGAFRAARVAKKVEDQGFTTEVIRIGTNEGLIQ